MAERILIQCTACGRPMVGRPVDDRFVVPTDDGNCRCGGAVFEAVEDCHED